jgi:hypothetical protein
MRPKYLSHRVSDWVTFFGWWAVMIAVWFISTALIGFIMGVTYRVLMIGWRLA